MLTLRDTEEEGDALAAGVAGRRAEAEHVHGASGGGDGLRSDTDADEDESEWSRGAGRAEVGGVIGRSAGVEPPSSRRASALCARSSTATSGASRDVGATRSASRMRRTSSCRLSASFTLRAVLAVPALGGDKGGTGRFSRQSSMMCEVGSLSKARNEVEEVGERSDGERGAAVGRGCCVERLGVAEIEVEAAR